MYSFTLAVVVALLSFTPGVSLSQTTASRTLVAVLAHADDEDPVAPILARYAREGVQIHLLIVTDEGRAAASPPRAVTSCRAIRSSCVCALKRRGVPHRLSARSRPSC
jgi:LmbE family N-acetylglucosaminyl deacetylase